MTFYNALKYSQAKIECNPSEILDFLVGDTGRVLSEYGGFLIEVYDHLGFPWYAVIRTLLRLNHAIWIEGRGEHIVILSKPKAD